MISAKKMRECHKHIYIYIYISVTVELGEWNTLLIRPILYIHSCIYNVMSPQEKEKFSYQKLLS